MNRGVLLPVDSHLHLCSALRARLITRRPTLVLRPAALDGKGAPAREISATFIRIPVALFVIQNERCFEQEARKAGATASLPNDSLTARPPEVVQGLIGGSPR